MNRIMISVVMPILFALAGCFLILLGITNIKNRQIFVESTGVISNIEETYVGGEDNEYDYDVTVDYTVDGQEYSSPLGEYNSRMQEGQEIGIYYNPDNPSEVMTNSKSTPVVLFVMGIIGIFAGVGLFIRSLTVRV